VVPRATILERELSFGIFVLVFKLLASQFLTNIMVSVVAGKNHESPTRKGRKAAAGGGVTSMSWCCLLLSLACFLLVGVVGVVVLDAFEYISISAARNARTQLYAKLQELDPAIIEEQIGMKLIALDEYNRIQMEATAIKTLYNKATSDAGVVKADLEVARKANEEKQRQLDSLTLQRDALQSQVSPVTAERDQFQQQVTTLTNDLHAARNMIDEKIRSVTSLTSQRDALQGQVTLVSTERDALSRQGATLTAEKIQLSTQLVALTTERNALLRQQNQQQVPGSGGAGVGTRGTTAKLRQETRT
jgi:hypothetical protein